MNKKLFGLGMNIGHIPVSVVAGDNPNPNELSKKQKGKLSHTPKPKKRISKHKLHMQNKCDDKCVYCEMWMKENFPISSIKIDMKKIKENDE